MKQENIKIKYCKKNIHGFDWKTNAKIVFMETGTLTNVLVY